MTTVFLFRVASGRTGWRPYPSYFSQAAFEEGERSVGVSQKRVIIGKFPQKYLFWPGGSTPLQAISDARASGVGLSCIYRAPFGANNLQSGRIYFEVQRWEGGNGVMQGHLVSLLIPVPASTWSTIQDEV